jgi:type VI secretion system protein ImpJ
MSSPETLSSIPAQTLSPIWTEGMYLRPQHFQQWGRYIEHYVERRCRGLEGAYWGFMELELDPHSLELGKVVLRRAHGTMPDGTPFSFNSTAEAPAAFDFPVNAKNVEVVLALPLRRPGSEEVLFTEVEGSPARYCVTESELADANAVAMGPAPVQLAQPRFRLLLREELGDFHQAVGVARVIERGSDHRLRLDEHYIPPFLDSMAHSALAGFVNEVHSLLQQRSHALAQRLSQPGRGGVGEVADFMMLELTNRSLASTWVAQQAPQRHPFELFHDWLKLAFDLATFTSPTRQPQQWPQYHHDNLQQSFAPLMANLRHSLSTVLEQSAISIALQDRGHGVRVGSIPSPDLLRDAGFILAVHAELPGEVVRTRFPAQIKLGTVERIRDLVQLQLPGINVRTLPVAPRQIPYNAGYLYFEIEKRGEMWQQLQKTGVLALHLAGEFPGLDIELWAVRG